MRFPQDCLDSLNCLCNILASLNNLAKFMSNDEINRKVTVIFATDVVGYSKAMEQDEIQALKNLRACRGILEKLFVQHGGRIFNTAGDSVLAEFSSAVSALVCASEFQELIKERNNSQDNNKKMEFRIGINIGDVVQENGNLYGEGVNIAARLEALAQPNGICVSKNIYDLVKSKTQFFFSDLGEKKVKNTIVHAFDLSKENQLPSKDRRRNSASKSGFGYRKLVIAVIALLSCSVLFMQWKANTIRDHTSNVLAVMPFTGNTSTEDSDYFIDGITEDLIVDLSKVNGLTLISANSVFQFKSKNYLDSEAANLLGADYLLKGTVRKKADKIRVNIELVNGEEGQVVWANGFEKFESEIFELEDEITLAIAKQLKLSVPKEVRAQIEAKSTISVEAYDLYKRGLASSNSSEARSFYERAISVDPNFARAHASMGINIALQMIGNSATSLSDLELKVLKDEALNYTQLSQQFDPDGAHGYLAEAIVLNSARLFERAQSPLNKALTLEPNNVLAMTLYGSLKANSGAFEEALSQIKRIKTLDPLYPLIVAAVETRANIGLENYEAALKSSEAVLERNPNSFGGMVYYITAAWKLGQKEDALWQYDEFDLVSPDTDVQAFLRKTPWHKKVNSVVSEVFKEIENSD